MNLVSDSSSPATSNDIEKIVNTAVQIATINTTLTDHERRITAQEAAYGKMVFWMIGTFASSFTALGLIAMDIVLKVTGVFK